MEGGCDTIIRGGGGGGKFTPTLKSTVPLGPLLNPLAWTWTNTSWKKFHPYDVTKFLLTSAKICKNGFLIGSWRFTLINKRLVASPWLTPPLKEYRKRYLNTIIDFNVFLHMSAFFYTWFMCIFYIFILSIYINTHSYFDSTLLKSLSVLFTECFIWIIALSYVVHWYINYLEVIILRQLPKVCHVCL